MDILKIEWLKLKKYRTFIWLLILTAAGILGGNYLIYNITARLGNMAPGGVMTTVMPVGPFAFPEVWHTVSYISSFLNILPGLLIILLVCNEYNFRTHRQNVIDGLSRTSFITGKMMLALLFALGFTVMVVIAAIIFGMFGGGSFSLENFVYIGYSFVQTLSYLCVAMAVALLFKRSGVAVMLYVIYALIIENVLGVLLSNNVLKGLGDFLPLQSAQSLIPPPTVFGKLFSSGTPDSLWPLVTALAWIVMLLWFCKRKFERSDLAA